MLLVIGGADLIGSNIVTTLNDAGSADPAVCEQHSHEGKCRKLASHQPADSGALRCWKWTHRSISSSRSGRACWWMNIFASRRLPTIAKPYGEVRPVDIRQISARRRWLPTPAEA